MTVSFFLGVEHRKCFFRGCVFMNDRLYRLHHTDRVRALEDVTAHVDTDRASLDRVVRHLQCLLLRLLLPTRDHHRHRLQGADLVVDPPDPNDLPRAILLRVDLPVWGTAPLRRLGV